jgi:hypothetical protein
MFVYFFERGTILFFFKCVKCFVIYAILSNISCKEYLKLRTRVQVFSMKTLLFQFPFNPAKERE